MPNLDTRGDIAAGQLAFYVPVAVVCLVLVARYGMRRDAGFFFLLVFSLMRITGGALIIAGELSVPSNASLFTASYIMFEVGLAILMLATLGFFGLAGQHTYSEYKRTTNIFRFVGFLCIAALAFAVAGGALSAVPGPSSPDRADAAHNVNTGMILRRVAAAMYCVIWLALVGVAFMCWGWRYELRSYRRRMLIGVTLALLPLGVRCAYAVLDAWSSSDLYGLQLSSNPTLARFNPITSPEWVIYLCMGLLMEYLTALGFLLASTVMARRHRRY